jgi:hypothetical protein
VLLFIYKLINDSCCSAHLDFVVPGIIRFNDNFKTLIVIKVKNSETKYKIVSREYILLKICTYNYVITFSVSGRSLQYIHAEINGLDEEVVISRINRELSTKKWKLISGISLRYLITHK